MQQQHLPPTEEPVAVPVPDGDLRFWPRAFDEEEATQLFVALRDGIAWTAEEVVILGRPRLVPRLVAWHGDADAAYTYSGTPHAPRPWTPDLSSIRARV